MSLLQVFDASELEFLTAGTLEIDVEDWKKHTEYRNGMLTNNSVLFLENIFKGGGANQYFEK